MTFNSLSYLIFFLAVILGARFLPGRRPQQFFLTAASLFFYAEWNSYLVLLIVGSALVDYYIAQRMHDSESPVRRRLWLILSLSSNLGLLFYFKYANFFLASFYQLQLRAGLHLLASAPVLHVVLPVGISFYTFQALSYTVDVYRRKLEPLREVPRFLMFISFFPQLVAGPIVRASDFLPQLNKRAEILPRNVRMGFTFFLVGLVKKSVFADGLAPFVEKVYGQPHLYSSVPVVIATVAYAVQIYCDFSGYTDMAIGSAIALGFWLPKNFAHPYFSASITEFWQRWHISLSTWLRDYLYIPLGGNRRGVARTYINLMIVMLLGGLWHGAKWTFVVWGGYQGALLALHRCCLNLGETRWLSALRASAAWRALCVCFTFYLVLIGWILFRAENFGDVEYLVRKFVLFDGFRREYGIYLREALFAMVLIVGFGLLHATSYRLGGLAARLSRSNHLAWCFGVTAGLFAVMILTPSRSPVFIYFQF
jgi:alginate O-acetyltransferase complex protein AlgI